MTSPPSGATAGVTPEVAERTVATPTGFLCLNCGAAGEGRYCAACGQRSSTARLRFPSLLRDGLDQLLSLDARVVRTAGALLRSPGPFTRSYLLGRRVGYSGPGTYYLLAVALNIAVGSVLPGRHDEGTSFWDENFVALQIGLVFALLLVPIAAAQRLSHEQDGYSTAEHYAHLLYALAQSILLLVALRLALWPFGESLRGDADGLTVLALFTSYTLWSSRGFVREPLWQSALKLLGAYGAGLVALAVVGAVIMALT